MTRRVDEIVRGPIERETLFPVRGYGIMQRKMYSVSRRYEERGLVSAARGHPTKRSRLVDANALE